MSTVPQMQSLQTITATDIAALGSLLKKFRGGKLDRILYPLKKDVT